MGFSDESMSAAFGVVSRARPAFSALFDQQAATIVISGAVYPLTADEESRLDLLFDHPASFIAGFTNGFTSGNGPVRDERILPGADTVGDRSLGFTLATVAGVKSPASIRVDVLIMRKASAAAFIYLLYQEQQKAPPSILGLAHVVSARMAARLDLY